MPARLISHIVTDLISCVGQLLVANLVFLDGRRRRSAVALPLGILALDMFAWNFFDFAYSASGQKTWHDLDLAFSPFSPPLAFHLIANFVGKGRAWRPIVISGYAAALPLAALAAAALFCLVVSRSWIRRC